MYIVTVIRATRLRPDQAVAAVEHPGAGVHLPFPPRHSPRGRGRTTAAVPILGLNLNEVPLGPAGNPQGVRCSDR